MPPLPRSPSPLLVHGALLLVSLLFGAHYVTTKLVIEAVPPKAWVCFRIAAATLILVPLALRFGRGKRPSLRLVLLLVIASLLGVVLNQVLFTEGLALTTPDHSAVINSCIPTWTLCLAVLFRQERLTWMKTLAVLTALAGVGTLLRADELLQNSEQLSRDQLFGDLLTWTNGVAFSLHLIMMRRIGREIDPWLATVVLFLAATAMVPAYGASELTAENWSLATSQPTIWFGLYTILFATVMTYVLNTWALKHTHSSQVALYTNVQPIVAAAVGPLFAMPAPDWRFFVALAAVATALVLQTRKA